MDAINAFLLRFFSRNSLYFVRVDLHFLFLRARNLLLFKAPRRTKPQARWLNVGCGECGIRSADWFNIDSWLAAGVDFACDLRRPLPFEDGRFQGIYAEHFFEHLHPDDGRRFLTECFRLLRPRGVLRLSVPDGELYLRKYVADPSWLVCQIDCREWLRGNLQGSQRTGMSMVNEIFRQGYEHQYCYDYETLSLCLSEAGFARVSRVDFRSGDCKELQIDLPSRREESLYVEAHRF